ncbi:MAG: hypothetical protein J6L70_00535 [Alphaproteobacteria bacterium]|nr:hypothetical protein [Alphaproteobacteria bacterium]
MKKLSIVSAVMGLAFVGAASAADITVYYSPTCPHCHHARDFISNNLVYEYPMIKVTEVNVMDQANLPKFQETLKKCEYESGGVPVLTIGEKCFQGYADFMQTELREAVEADLSDDDKAAASENKKAMEADAEKFKSENADRKNAISEYVANADASVEEATAEKKNNNGSSIWFWGLLVVLVAGLGVVLVRKDKK